MLMNTYVKNQFLIFLYTTDNPNIIESEWMPVHGFFTKENTAAKIKSTMKIIVDYWKTLNTQINIYNCKNPKQ